MFVGQRTSSQKWLYFCSPQNPNHQRNKSMVNVRLKMFFFSNLILWNLSCREDSSFSRRSHKSLNFPCFVWESSHASENSVELWLFTLLCSNCSAMLPPPTVQETHVRLHTFDVHFVRVLFTYLLMSQSQKKLVQREMANRMWLSSNYCSPAFVYLALHSPASQILLHETLSLVIPPKLWSNAITLPVLRAWSKIILHLLL